MNMANRDRSFIEDINVISKSIQENIDLIGDDLTYQIKDKVDRISGSIDSIKQDGRVLRIGIVGTVKAGKSSFLNALVFKGNNVLPKAPTPMTAALTKICYASVPKAKIVFYEKFDWKNIMDMAKKYHEKIDEAFKAQEKAYEQLVRASPISSNGMPIQLPPIPNRNQIENQLRHSLSESLVSSAELVDMVEHRDTTHHSERRQQTMSEKIVQLNEDVIKGQIKELV